MNLNTGSILIKRLQPSFSFGNSCSENKKAPTLIGAEKIYLRDIMRRGIPSRGLLSGMR